MTKVVRRGPVVVDTGVFAAELTRAGSDLAERYRSSRAGTSFIYFVTEAKVRFGARPAGWGAARLRKLEQRLAAVEVVWPGPGLVEGYVELRSRCVGAGHGLGQKSHEADRWIAAMAMWLHVPLVTHDGIFSGLDEVASVTVQTRLGEARG